MARTIINLNDPVYRAVIVYIGKDGPVRQCYGPYESAATAKTMITKRINELKYWYKDIEIGGGYVETSTKWEVTTTVYEK